MTRTGLPCKTALDRAHCVNFAARRVRLCSRARRARRSTPRWGQRRADGARARRSPIRDASATTRTAVTIAYASSRSALRWAREARGIELPRHGRRRNTLEALRRIGLRTVLGVMMPIWRPVDGIAEVLAPPSNDDFATRLDLAHAATRQIFRRHALGVREGVGIDYCRSELELDEL